MLLSFVLWPVCVGLHLPRYLVAPPVHVACNVLDALLRTTSTISSP